MGAYHNKLDKKYFNKSIYVRKFEKAFDIRIKDYPLQYEIMLDTYNTFIIVNNILFSLNYMPTNQRVDNILHTLNSYLTKYKNKVKKSYDSNCIRLYDSLENIFNELSEMKKEHETRKINYNLKPVEKEVELLMNILIAVNFDMLVDSKTMPFEKKANDKLPKKVNCKIIDNINLLASTLYDEDKQKQLNDDFINNYLKITGIDLNQEKEQRHFIFDTLNRIKDLNNALVDYYIYKDKAVLNIFNNALNNYLTQDITYVKDITYINIFNKLKDINKLLNADDIDNAYDKIKELLDQFKSVYERNS